MTREGGAELKVRYASLTSMKNLFIHQSEDELRFTSEVEALGQYQEANVSQALRPN